ncbi:cellulose biosynthesis protein BcsQ [Aeromonas lusitana]|uniref:Cellulose synthase operon protein YhjQ n=1 Tax=Aeromonas lusitana TaxID=931529 RepID=A0A2M8HBC8_9GAMM|nr:cellulose biosynthesis protein BcsQ [Aeromonas lusitana]PJC93840.1 cellulose synthase operon protein YhjQ [Aeromonas lusitana]
MNIVALQGIRGGVGTTSIVAGLAWAAREQGARVLAVDLCPDNLLGIHLGLPHDEAVGWRQLSDPAREWRSALHPYETGLDLLAYGYQPNGDQSNGGQSNAGSLDWLQAIEGYDLLLLDVPLDAALVLPCRRLTVVNADANSHVRLYRRAWVADERLLVTQFTSRRALQQDLLDLWSAAGLPQLTQRLHRDEAMAEAMAAKQPVGRYSPTSLIAHELNALALWCLMREADA